MSNDFDESSSNKETSKGLSWWYSTDVISQDKDDRASKRIRRMKLTDRLIRHPGRLSILYFSVLILLSTGLLTLPISTTNHDASATFRCRSSPRFPPVHLRHSGGEHRRVLVDVRPSWSSCFPSSSVDLA